MNGNKQTEDRIETVLAALRQAEPTPGMEQRIAAVLLRQADAASTAKSRWMGMGKLQLAGSMVTLAAAGLLSLYVFRHDAAMPVYEHVSTSTGATVGRSKDGALEALSAQRSHVVAPASTHSPTIAYASRPPAKKTHTQTYGASEASQPEEPFKAGHAKAEQGFPAPPLPLTEQERLLLRLVHRGDPVQLAQLAPAAREMELQRDREQVRDFFKPLPMLSANFVLEPYPTPGGTQ